MRASVTGESAVLRCECWGGYERLSVSFGWKMIHFVVRKDSLTASVVHRDSASKERDDVACNLTCLHLYGRHLYYVLITGGCWQFCSHSKQYRQYAYSLS